MKRKLLRPALPAILLALILAAGSINADHCTSFTIDKCDGFCDASTHGGYYGTWLNGETWAAAYAYVYSLEDATVTAGAKAGAGNPIPDNNICDGACSASQVDWLNTFGLQIFASATAAGTHWEDDTPHAKKARSGYRCSPADEH